ncbi:MAG: DUF1638 domain-containing protein [Chloroflexi bacterium]|nr:DUF1638 domain-containing protein [Chloroflexota bacterium]
MPHAIGGLKVDFPKRRSDSDKFIMRLKCLACESLARPVYYAAAQSPHIVDVTLVERHLHQPAEIGARLQLQIDAAEGQGYDAIIMAYGLCGGATAGLAARSIPLVIPRAHDCITLYLGSRGRYQQEMAKEPGTYWYAQDYIERNSGGSAALAMGQGAEADMQSLYEHYIRKYGKAKADRLMEVMDGWLSHYKRAVYLDTGLGGDGKVEMQARAEAQSRGWVFERIAAELNLVRRLLAGPQIAGAGEWDADFLVVSPGQKIVMAYDEKIIETGSVS